MTPAELKNLLRNVFDNNVKFKNVGQFVAFVLSNDKLWATNILYGYGVGVSEKNGWQVTTVRRTGASGTTRAQAAADGSESVEIRLSAEMIAEIDTLRGTDTRTVFLSAIVRSGVNHRQDPTSECCSCGNRFRPNSHNCNRCANMFKG